ncbi:predicted protein [Coccidioides posadasii str. Silveira]|uniref:Predicted protein n=1 Tax=Coccidioides posadasii (strain RMSCC 757 / Silveira) TaxID=443226 RepID=E9DD62_COCPS|nr:predicted protein [Coccidioides posadasii str. Silveira]
MVDAHTLETLAESNHADWPQSRSPPLSVQCVSGDDGIARAPCFNEPLKGEYRK